MNTNTCPSCRASIPADAPGGICPSCALLGVVQPTVMMPGSAAGVASSEEVAAAFPDLEVLERIGYGGMGVVFKARQQRLDRLVALKILPLHLAAQAGFAERFTREARALARLHHPHIVTVFDFGESGGFYYLIMEYVDGVNLRKAIQAGMKPEQAMLLVPRICEALQFAHDHGVLHRDIKPENILLDTKGRPKLADFGIAKFSGEAFTGLTLSGAALGTAAYMAPEQIEKPATVDHRADIYSLGVVFYEMLTGELPLGRFAAPSEKAAVGQGVDAVVLRALEKERDRRQQSAGEMKTQVEGTPLTGPVSTPPPIPPAPALTPDEGPPESGMKHLLGILCALAGIGIPASAVVPGFHRIGLTPPAMVFLCAALGVLAAAWPGKRPPHRRTIHPMAPSVARVRHPFARAWFESRSARWLFGRPLYHIVRGSDPATGVTPVARGIIAIGPVAHGWLAFGGKAHGVIAFGGMATGVVTFGGVSIGIFSAGGLAVGLLCAVGGFSAGSLVLGGAMAGLAPMFVMPSGRPVGGAMIFGPVLEMSGWTLDSLRRIAIGTGILTAVSSFIVMMCAFLSASPAPQPAVGNAPAPPVNPWPRRIFWLLFLVVFGPALLVLVVLPFAYRATRDEFPGPYQNAAAVDVVRSDRGPVVAKWSQGTAELISVSRHPSSNDQPRWRLKGDPASEGPFEWPGGHAPAGQGQRAWEFVFRLRDLPPGSNEPHWLVQDGITTTGGAPSLKSAPGVPLRDCLAIAAALPEDDDRANIKLGIAPGPWITLAAGSTNSVQGAGLYRDGIQWYINQGTAVETAAGAVAVTYSHSRPDDWQIRVVALNTANQEITAASGPRVGDQTEWSFAGLKLADVKEFRFQVRRYEWVEFRRIPLSPRGPAKPVPPPIP